MPIENIEKLCLDLNQTMLADARDYLVKFGIDLKEGKSLNVGHSNNGLYIVEDEKNVKYYIKVIALNGLISKPILFNEQIAKNVIEGLVRFPKMIRAYSSNRYNNHIYSDVLLNFQIKVKVDPVIEEWLKKNLNTLNSYLNIINNYG